MIRQEEMKVKVGETRSAVTGFGGASALVVVAHQTGMVAALDEQLRIKRRRRGYAPSASVMDLMLLLCAGGECIDDLAVLREDRGLCRLLGRRVMAPSTAHDFLRKAGSGALDALAAARRQGLRSMAAAREVKRATLDCDAVFFASSVREARMSYLGERGWMPMVAYWAELGAVVHEEFRHGNEPPGSGALRFLKEAVAQLPECVEQVRVRSDSAWYIAELMDWCHEHGHQFSITADKDAAVSALIDEVSEPQWAELEAASDTQDGHRPLRQWAHETVHTLNESRHAYRIILLRRERRHPDLFEGAYTYGAIITNMQRSLDSQLRWHYERCNSENHHKELKHGLSLRVLPSGDFAVNAAWFRIGMLAYNLLAALKHLKLDESWRYLTVKTVRFRLLRIPALVVRHARTLWLRAPRGHPHLAALRASLV